MVSSQRIVKSGPMETIDYEAFDGSGADGRAAAIRSHDPRNDDPVVVGSCDGLVCFKVRGGFLLYNPTTGESRNVPISDLDLTGEGKFFHGFGYDPAFDEYKIVHVYYVEDPGMWWVAIFSLRSGSWRRMMVQLDIHPGGFNTNYPPIYSGLGFGWHKSRQGICWNGALHWCLELRELSNIDLYDSKPVIVSFNLSEENFHREIPVPNLDAMMRISIVGLGIHGANLLMYVGTPHFFMAWIMKENGIGGSWEELYKVSTGGIYILTWQQIPIVYTRREKIVFELGSSEMILFNPQHGNVEGYPIRVNGGSAIYIETLVSPYLGCEPSRI
ncbi:hypothetical protein EUGRSUZ_A00241 [Eucalyptus grandis]|uniref:Uncharacterized protein n=2 Tax=Eucalyptus grandis TaxID=71139 RepID=A0ACC3LYS1_EUCGR|nr:hypothetical protein EUGRSUZ_A00241 [Eucalyptus grandis]